MNQNPYRMRFKNMDPNELKCMQQRAEQSSFSDRRKQKEKETEKTTIDLYERRGHGVDTETMMDLLKDPASLDLKGGFRGFRH